MVKQKPLRLIQSLYARSRGAFLIVAALVTMFGLSFGTMNNVQAAGPTSSYGQNVSSCEIETVGWVICPVMRSIAKLADYGFAFINQNFLKIEYGIANSSSGVYKAWEVMRTVANATFVLAFMWIVYAQITGRSSAGGYGIKRMLPRLIIGAILVNVSFYVCVIGIELSNIIGGSILTIMQQVTDRIGPAAMTLSSAQNGFDDSRLSDITSAILTKSGTVWILLAPVAAVTISIALICAAGLVLLIMRKVVVAMLVLISPLMFVTYLLPNTERYFQQWLRLFFQLLLLYPVIAFLLGTGQIISATIINVGSESDSNYRVRDDGYQARNGGSGSVTTDLAAAGAAVLPLLGTWFLLKAASSVVTNAGTKVAGNITRRGKNDEKKIKAQMEGKAKQSINGTGLPTYNRKPAFSRLRRRGGAASFADGLATKGTPKQAGKTQGNTPSLLDRAMGNVNSTEPAKPDATPNESKEAAEARIAEAEANQIKGELSAAATNDDKKNKTAKDIFNNLNKTHQMEGGKNGSGGGSSSGGGDAQPSGPVASPQAPSNNYTAASTPQQSSQSNASQPQVIAVPVQVDASSFLKQDNQAMASSGAAHLPTNEVANKATERANKYLFKAENDVEKASDRLDAIKEIRDEQRKADEKNKQHKDDK